MRWKQFFTPVSSMNPDEAREYLSTKDLSEVTILDVRQPKEYEAGHIPGATLVPLPALTDSLAQIDPTRPVLVYCAIGGRSRVAAQALAGKGYEQVINISGGFKAWTGQAAYGLEDTGLELFTDLGSIEQILATAYSLEEGLRDFYLKMLDKVSNAQVKSLFSLLAEIEIKHKDRLFEEYTRLTGKEDRGAFETSAVLQVVEGGLTTEEYLDRFSPDLSSTVDVISLAMSIEAQALDLYTRAAAQVKNEEYRAVLTQIAKEEQEHLKRLGQLLDEQKLF